MHILWWIVVGLIAGWLTGKIMKGTGYGVFGDIILGIVGAVIGGFIMRQLGFAGQGGLIHGPGGRGRRGGPDGGGSSFEANLASGEKPGVAL